MESLLDGITGVLVGKSLDMSLVQHRIIANNIANAETQGYRPLRLDFAGQMERLEQLLAREPDAEVIAQMKAIDVSDGIEVDELSTRVQIDREMTALAKNTINYQALLTANGKLGSILSMAIKGGRD